MHGAVPPLHTRHHSAMLNKEQIARKAPNYEVHNLQKKTTQVCVCVEQESKTRPRCWGYSKPSAFHVTWSVPSAQITQDMQHFR